MSNTEKFYQWMKRINNIYLNDNDRMVRAFHIVANSDFALYSNLFEKNKITNQEFIKLLKNTKL